MKNPRTLADLKADPRVQDVYREYEEDGSSSWWLHLHAGWESPDMECGTIHEHTLREVCALFARIQPVQH